ncbi:MAG: TRIC cation channel family protein, partial [Candidatus Neoclostridium sp.]
MNVTQTIFEIIGIIGFSMSGTMVALQNRMDVVGSLILANVTALGGGV